MHNPSTKTTIQITTQDWPIPEWCGKLSLLFQTQNLSGDWLKVMLPESVFVGGAQMGVAQ